MGTLNVYSYVMFSTPPPIKFCSLSLISSSSSNINFIHNHTWSLYICSLAFECCNIALVLLCELDGYVMLLCELDGYVMLLCELDGYVMLFSVN